MNAIRTYRDALALVTGGGSGIGQALAVELARRGATVALADVDREGLARSAELVRQAGGQVSAEVLDVRSAVAFAEWARKEAERAGRLDYLFNNAGIAGTGGFAQCYQPGDWDAVIDINLRGVVNGVHAVYPLMVQQGFGHIVNTASLAGLIPFPLALPYVAAKHAVVGLSKSLRFEAELHGVRVSALCPGVIRTPILTSANFIGCEDVTDERLLKWWRHLRPSEPGPFAAETLDRVARNVAVILVPRYARIAAALGRLFPWLERRMLRKELAMTLRSFPEIEAAASRSVADRAA